MIKAGNTFSHDSKKMEAKKNLSHNRSKMYHNVSDNYGHNAITKEKLHNFNFFSKMLNS